jgi:hypothetical protein
VFGFTVDGQQRRAVGLHLHGRRRTVPGDGHPGRLMSTATFDQVADGVYTALRRQFGGSADVVETGRDERTAVFGFTVDGVDYSLSVNITE